MACCRAELTAGHSCCLSRPAHLMPASAPGARPAANARRHAPEPAAEEKKLKLRSPNFVVSETRLSVRNIPPSWTEKELKACFIKAVGASAGGTGASVPGWRRC